MILFDIYHTPQLNFFKPTIIGLKPDQCIIVVLDRGKLLDIALREFPGYTIIPLGDYRLNRGFKSMVFDIILPRIKSLKRIIREHDIQFVITANYQANVVAKMAGVPNIVFNDDPRNVVIQLAEWAADICYVTKGIKRKKSIELNMLKEWAYLNPNVFTPNIKALEPFGLEPFEYLFIRDVDTNTTNYYHQVGLTALDIEINSTPVILSLENKSRLKDVPKHWIVLKEPLDDIHSLMYFSKAFLSTGDSMAREAAELGVPAYYLGTRDMPANQILIDLGLLSKITIGEVSKKIESLQINLKTENQKRESHRNSLKLQWDDVNEIILDHLKLYLNK